MTPTDKSTENPLDLLLNSWETIKFSENPLKRAQLEEQAKKAKAEEIKYRQMQQPKEVNATADKVAQWYKVPSTDPDIQALKQKDETEKIDPQKTKLEDDTLKNLTTEQKQQVQTTLKQRKKQLLESWNTIYLEDIWELFKELSKTLKQLFWSFWLKYNDSWSEWDWDAKTNFTYQQDWKRFNFDKNLSPWGNITVANFIVNDPEIRNKFWLNPNSIKLDQYRHSWTSPLCAYTTRMIFEKNWIAIESWHARDLFHKFKQTSWEMRWDKVWQYLQNQVKSWNNFFDITMCWYKANWDPNWTSWYHRIAGFYWSDWQIYVMDPYFTPKPTPPGWPKHNPAPFPLQNHPHIQNPNVRFAIWPSHKKTAQTK